MDENDEESAKNGGGVYGTGFSVMAVDLTVPWA